MQQKVDGGTEFQRRPYWYKDAVIYQVHVKSFFDADGDGTGDLRGLIEKLDYIRDLGVTALWLLPFYPSPLRDDGYDIADYMNVNPVYGTLTDFSQLLAAAHERGLYVITELVINHTSDQHPWFQRARSSPPGSPHRDFYVWSDDKERYADARIIFQDFEASNWTWDPLARAYYWHRFYSHQPDLNFDNPAVHAAVKEVLDFWFAMGVDGLRLDAVPYLYEREGTNCENLPETHDYLRALRSHVDERWDNRMLLAEANQWPEDAVRYFGQGDECHMAFHFPLMPRIYMAVEMEDRFPVMDIIDQTPRIPEPCQWAIFLRNHDELTLEMVTDEERDYMYRVFAKDRRARINLGIRRRLAPLLGNNRRKIELLNGLLFSLPGTPVIYYGDEIGMGDNYYLGDRNGVRTPMQWSPDRNAGFSRVNSQQLYLPIIIDPEYHYEAINVDNQERTTASLLWWMRQRIALRNRHPAFGHGDLEFVKSDNQKLLIFLRRHETEVVLVAANLSATPQTAQVDLHEFAGASPLELTGQSRFPVIGSAPYLLMLGAHEHLWLSLPGAQPRDSLAPSLALPILPSVERIGALLEPPLDERIERIMPLWIPQQRWFRSKTRKIREVVLEAAVTLPGSQIAASLQLDAPPMYLCTFRVSYWEGDPERYVVPLAFAPEATPIPAFARIATVTVAGIGGSLCDGSVTAEFRSALLRLMLSGGSLPFGRGKLVGHARVSREAAEVEAAVADSQAMNADQSNSSFVFPAGHFVKLFRKLEEGLNPDPEITRFLAEETSFKNSPRFEAGLEVQVAGEEPRTVALAQELVAAERDAWSFVLQSMIRYLEKLETRRSAGELPPDVGPLGPVEFHLLPTAQQEAIGGAQAEFSNLLGIRTAELHLALASSSKPAFVPEPYTQLYQRSVYQSIRSLTRRNLDTLRANRERLTGRAVALCEQVLLAEDQILGVVRRIAQHRIDVDKIRIHGDYHLGQVLFTGKDFILLDFEGEPGRSAGERRLKRSALRDVAGMLRSFHYAAHAGLRHHLETRGRDSDALIAWTEGWYRDVAGIFLNAYLERAAGAGFLPATAEDLYILLNAFLLEKAVYELGYELNNRPDWVAIPLEGILSLLRGAAASGAVPPDSVAPPSQSG